MFVCTYFLCISHPFTYSCIYNQGACLESGAHFVPRPLGCDVPQDIICIDRPIGATIPSCFQKLPQWPPSLAPFRSKYRKHTECYKFRSGKTHVYAYIYINNANVYLFTLNRGQTSRRVHAWTSYDSCIGSRASSRSPS